MRAVTEEEEQQLVFHLLEKAQSGDKEEVKKMKMEEEEDEGEERLVKVEEEKLATEAQEDDEATKNYPGNHIPQAEEAHPQHAPKNFQLTRLLLKKAQEEGEQDLSKNRTLPQPPPSDSLQFLRDLQVLAKGQGRRARRDTCKQVGI